MTMYSPVAQNFSREDLVLQSSPLGLEKKETYLSSFCSLLKYSSSEEGFSPLSSKALKCLTTVCSFVSQYPSMEAAMRVSSNPVLKRLFAVGEIVAWGCVYTFISIEVIDNFLINRELNVQDKNTSCFHSKVYWLSLAIISLSLQVSDMYISYVYTNSLFWPLFVGGVYASFTLSSLNGAIQKTLKTNNFLTRRWYGTDTCENFAEKEEFCNLLKHSIGAFESNPIKLEGFAERLSSQGSKRQLAQDLIALESIGKKRKNEEGLTGNSCGSCAKKIVKLVSLIFLLSNYILDVNLVYKSSHLISKNIFFSVFLITVSTVPDIYLDLQMSSNAISDFLWATATHVNNMVKGNCGSYFNKKSLVRGIGNVFTPVISVLGLGSTITVVRDNIGFGKYGPLAYSILFFTFFFASDAVSDLTSRGVDRLIGCFEDEEETKLRLVRGKIKLLASRIEQMSANQFRDFMSEIRSNTQ